jgi:phospholipase/carboxylesterase
MVTIPIIHQNMPVKTAGVPLAEAQIAMIMIHGRGATAEDILTLHQEFDQPQVAYLAPQAAGYQWYPNRFIAPVASNEPDLSAALATVDGLVKHIQESGIPSERIILLGFSQGACLALEYAARNPRRYGGVAGLSGGLIGDRLPTYTGSLEETPIFLGCSDVDFHIPKERVLESATVLRGLGAVVTDRLYPNMGHTINQDEIAHVQQVMQSALT